MKVAIIFLDYSRHEHTKKALESIGKAGYPFDLFTINRFGVAAALNEGLDKTKQYDAVVFCANDIRMPEDWLAVMVSYLKKIENSGVVGFHTVLDLPPISFLNGMPIHQTPATFGNCIMSRKLIDTIGYYNEDHDPYGMQDSDFCYRAEKAGFINYYIPILEAEHIGHDVGNQTEYRKMKDESLIRVHSIYNDIISEYERTGNYYVNKKNG